MFTWRRGILTTLLLHLVVGSISGWTTYRFASLGTTWIEELKTIVAYTPVLPAAWLIVEGLLWRPFRSLAIAAISGASLTSAHALTIFVQWTTGGGVVDASLLQWVAEFSAWGCALGPIAHWLCRRVWSRRDRRELLGRGFSVIRDSSKTNNGPPP